MQVWYVNKQGAQLGPMDEQALAALIRSGELSADSWVRGGGPWQPIAEHPSFGITSTPVSPTAQTVALPALQAPRQHSSMAQTVALDVMEDLLAPAEREQPSTPKTVAMRATDLPATGPPPARPAPPFVPSATLRSAWSPASPAPVPLPLAGQSESRPSWLTARGIAGLSVAALGVGLASGAWTHLHSTALAAVCYALALAAIVGGAVLFFRRGAAAEEG